MTCTVTATVMGGLGAPFPTDVDLAESTTVVVAADSSILVKPNLACVFQPFQCTTDGGGLLSHAGGRLCWPAASNAHRPV